MKKKVQTNPYSTVSEYGMTKLEYFSALAMQSLISEEGSPQDIARRSVWQAWELIGAINDIDQKTIDRAERELQGE